MPTHNAAIESVAKALIVNSEGNVLTLALGEHHARPERSHSPDLPGGIVDSGESERMAVVREVNEECGIVLDSSKIQLVYSHTKYYEAEHKSVTKLLYVAHVDEEPVVKLSWEHSDYRWVTLDELKEIDFRPVFKEAIRYSLANGLLTRSIKGV